jgi:hypothetical protein
MVLTTTIFIHNKTIKKMKQIIAALLKAQMDMGNAKKDSKNPFYNSKYADLNSVREAIMPHLNENKILILQPMITIDGCEYVKTVLLHESGETIESFTKILCKSQNDPQAYGSGVTYARRYGLQSLLSIGADDDDGNNASKEKTQKQQEKPSFLNVDEAVKEMKAVKSYSEISTVWNKYVGLQKNELFISATKDAGVKFPKQ